MWHTIWQQTNERQGSAQHMFDPRLTFITECEVSEKWEWNPYFNMFSQMQWNLFSKWLYLTTKWYEVKRSWSSFRTRSQYYWQTKSISVYKWSVFQGLVCVVRNHFKVMIRLRIRRSFRIRKPGSCQTRIDVRNDNFIGNLS